MLITLTYITIRTADLQITFIIVLSGVKLREVKVYHGKQYFHCGKQHFNFGKQFGSILSFCEWIYYCV